MESLEREPSSPWAELPNSTKGYRELPFSFLLLGRSLTKCKKSKAHLLLLSPTKQTFPFGLQLHPSDVRQKLRLSFPILLK